MDPGFYKHERKKNPRGEAGLFSIFTYWWLRELFSKGFRKPLVIDDIYNPLNYHDSDLLANKLEKIWMEECKKEKPSFLKTIIKAFGLKVFIFSATFTILDVVFRIAQPLCLGVLISYFEPGQTDISKKEAYIYASGVVFSMLMNIFLFHPFIIEIMYISMKMRLASCSLIYRKVLRLDLRTHLEDGNGLGGRVINLLTNDANKFDLSCIFLMEIWRAPIEGVIIIYIMYRNMGVASLIGVAFMLSFMPLQVWLSRVSANIRRRAALKTDYRIKMMNEVIQGIQIIKMYAWEYCFANFIKIARRKEMNLFRKISQIRAVIQCCIKLNTKISIFITIISYILLGNNVTAAKIFVMFSLYDLIRLSLVEFFPMAIMFVMDALVSVKRMQDFLLFPELKYLSDVPVGDSEKFHQNINSYCDDIIKNKNDNSIIMPIPNHNEKEMKYAVPYFELKNVTAFWKTKTSEETPEKEITALNNISLQGCSGDFIAIVGQVGSGKSTLLNAVIREMPIDSGTINITGPISYCSQMPWLFEASIRQNITFGLQMDKVRYKQVIKCCQLEADLKMFSHGDKTIVGERGVSLSGGQKARVSLARCVYREADIYLLDDPLSAVDARVAQNLLKSCIRGFLRSKVVILVTHQIQHIQPAKKICVMEAGKMIIYNSYDEFQRSPHNSAELFSTETDQKETPEKNDRKISENDSFAESYQSIRKGSISSLSSTGSIAQEKVKEGQEAGSVNAEVYKALVKSGGSYRVGALMIALFCFAQTFYSMCDVWISYWVNIEESSNAIYVSNSSEHIISDNNTKEINWSPDSWTERFYGSETWGLNRTECIYIYSTLILITIIFTLSKLILFFNVCIQASVNLHDQMFRSITRATMWFFNNNASGRILNRFSKDIGTIDTMLPLALLDCISFFFETIGILIVVCIANYWLLFPTAGIILLLLMVRMIFLATSRSLKRLEGISRSPAFTHVAASLSGLDTIRSSGKQNILIKEFDRHQNLHTSVWFLILNTNRAFAFWLDMICWLYLAIVTYSFVILSANTFGGKVGLAITQAIGLVGMCQWGMRQTAEVENQMTSVERINEYTKLTPEPPLETDENLVKKTHPKFSSEKWPESGTLELKNVYLSYDKDGDKILKNISFKVFAGEKVGIVGRTGAGKSSIVAALFRLTDTEGVILLDGVETHILGLHQLRSAMSIIPQDPMLFSGSLRENLDPWNQFSDMELWNALEEIEMKNMVTGLHSKVNDGGSNFSAGQRQLLCLARAILKNSHVLVLDEATANVDPETDKLIQSTIRRKFANKTVLTIAHRLHTVMDSDKVLVMDKGRVAEYGHPYELLTQSTLQSPQIYSGESLKTINEELDNISNTSKGNEQGMFKALVEQTGSSTSQMLFQIAEQSYKKIKLE